MLYSQLSYQRIPVLEYTPLLGNENELSKTINLFTSAAGRWKWESFIQLLPPEILNQIAQRENDLKGVEYSNQEKDLTLTSLRVKRQQLEQEKKDQEAKQARNNELQNFIDGLSQDRQIMMQSRMSTEERLDEANAKISTQFMVKRVIENKLELALEEKQRLQREKVHIFESWRSLSMILKI